MNADRKNGDTENNGCPDGRESNKPDARMINLAIQGGGSHGAFAWGVIDKLLEDGRIDVEGLCATSAGSMNAVVFAYGNMVGGHDGARESLYKFWKKISEMGAIFSPIKPMPWEHVTGQWNMDYPVTFAVLEMITRMFSPYQFNPMNFNPLRKVLEESVDFDRLKRCQTTKLFISTTKVRTGKVRVFRTEEITSDVVLASACLPFLFQAVKIGDDYYWDGGYMGNPALFPLFYHTDTRDLMIIHINPMEKEKLPTSAGDIMDRINEITFNSSLLKEMRAIAFVTKLIEEDMLRDEYKNRFKHLIMHSIRADKALCDLSVASKFNVEWKFLIHLRDLGRTTAAQWLKKNFNKIGKASTIDLRAEFLDLGVQHAG